MARQKEVFHGAEVAHLWAHQAQYHARNSSNVSYYGTDFSSYATVIGRIIKNKKGVQAYIIGTQYYSPTTCKHQAWVRRAIPDRALVFHVGSVSKLHTPREYFTEYHEKVMKLIGQWERARERKPWYMQDIEETVAEANKFAEFHGLKQRLSTDFGEMREISQKIAKANAAADKRRARAEEKKRQEQIAKNDEKRAAWLEGKGSYFPDEYDFPGRLRIVDDTVETSRRATVPLKHALRLFRVIQKCRKFNKPYKANGHTEHVGHYTVDEIDSDGNLRIGCHVIDWSEVERLAGQIPGLLCDGTGG